MKIFLLLALFTIQSCFLEEQVQTPVQQIEVKKQINPSLQLTEKTIATRFSVPPSYQRIEVTENSYAAYLRNLPLKPVGSEVSYYNGTKKRNNNVYIGVVDMDIDAQDLQQCADAVMRLRGEYLYHQKNYSDIHFNFLSDGKPRYYKDYVKGDYSYTKFRKYMKYVFSYANTASLRAELQKADQPQIGDVLIQKGNPYGHAVIIVDMAIHEKTGQLLYMLAQSYMPAQETQILINPSNKNISP